MKLQRDALAYKSQEGADRVAVYNLFLTTVGYVGALSRNPVVQGVTSVSTKIAGTVVLLATTYLDAKAALYPSEVIAMRTRLSHERLPSGTQGRIMEIKAHARSQSSGYEISYLTVVDGVLTAKSWSDVQVMPRLLNSKLARRLRLRNDEDAQKVVEAFAEAQVATIALMLGRLETEADIKIPLRGTIGPIDYGWYELNSPGQTIVSSLNPTVLEADPRSWIYTGRTPGRAQLRVATDARYFNEATAHVDTVEVGGTAAPQRPPRSAMGPPPKDCPAVWVIEVQDRDGRWRLECAPPK